MEEKLLKDYTDPEKGAYIGAIASLATADRTASEDELDFLEAISEAAELSPEQKEIVRNAAVEQDPELQPHLDVLKGSELRFSLLADLITFAESDQDFSDNERRMIENMAAYLNINSQQYQTINRFVQEGNTAVIASDTEDVQGFLNGGIGQELNKAGINVGSLTKGLLGSIAPVILGSLLSRGMGNRGGGLGGMLGGMLGQSGGLGGMLGGNQSGSGGLGSIIGMLNGGRGMKGAGDLLGKIFGGR